MKDVFSYFRLGVGSLIQFYLKLDMAINFVALTKTMNDPVLVITDIVMVQRLKQSHDITQTAPQIA